MAALLPDVLAGATEVISNRARPGFLYVVVE
ncbi:MAG: hypothetical protein ACI93T_001187 [Porticoccaceae bacterium]|jgi:hypothetical protein